MQPLRVAVIGAGAAGLCALRHLSARPSVFKAVAFEQTNRVGGTWVYTDDVGTDQYGLPVHSSMYRSLRTNIPKEVMAFPDFQFRPELPSFIKHTEVLEYLQDYADHYKLYDHIKFRTPIEKIRPRLENDTFKHWEITHNNVVDGSQSSMTELFDAVMVCNGHYSEPLTPGLPGASEFRGLTMHSHDYREASPFRNKRVVCLGANASGLDISLEISTVAKEVILSHNKPLVESAMPANIRQVPGIKRVEENSFVFNDNSMVEADALLHCTGYRFSFPFLSEECRLRIEDERITPLYKHLIHTTYPTLSFMGMCKIICPFPQFHCQALVVTSVLDGTVKLPPKAEMDADTKNDFEKRKAEGLPVRHAHLMGKRQWSYNNELAELAKFKPIAKSLQMLYDHVHETRVKNLQNYKNISYELTGPETFREVQGK